LQLLKERRRGWAAMMAVMVVPVLEVFWDA